MSYATVRPQNARGLVSAGLYSSASTWMFNLVAQIIRIGNRANVKTVYMDEVDEAAADALREASFFVAKSHMPGPSLRALLDLSGLPLILTVREPRDAVASLMLRWGLTFDQALRLVRASARAIARLAGYQPALLFRYEDGFMDDERSAETVALWLGVTLSAGDRAALLAELTPQAVRERIVAWQQSGVLGKGPPVLEYEPETHWHAGHVGDGQTGKWSRILNATQAARVLYAARSYCEAFDYPTSEPVGSGTELSFSETGVGTSYLSEGFSEPEPWGIWTNADQAVITLPLAVPTRKALRLELDLVYAPALCSPPSEALAQVTLNDELVREVRPGRWLPKRWRLVIDHWIPRLANTDCIRIGFKFAGLGSPAELRSGSDWQRRRLGLVRLRVDYE